MHTKAIPQLIAGTEMCPGLAGGTGDHPARKEAELHRLVGEREGPAISACDTMTVAIAASATRRTSTRRSDMA